jgi:hypothetical protein
LRSLVRKTVERISTLAKTLAGFGINDIVRFGVLYCFFVISRDGRRILHFNITKHPTSLWIVQQLREAFPFDSTSRLCSSIAMPSTGWKSRSLFAP